MPDAPSRPLALMRVLADAGREHGVTPNALGGVGVELRAGPVPETLRREPGDLDVVIRRSERRQAEGALAGVGLVPDDMFNRRNGHRRQIWWTPDGATHVDVFVGRFDMCHEVELESRIDPAHSALPATDLLLTKLQVVELNVKDVFDAAALLGRLEVGDEDAPGIISTARLADVLARDWGFYTTFTDNLERLGGEVETRAPGEAGPVKQRVERITEALAAAPKTRSWKMRARVGRHKRWYALPDESLEEDSHSPG